jgi:phosphatidylinositol phosphate synthase
VAAGLSGLGVPFVLAIGLWALAVLSTITFGQRVLAVRAAAAAQQAGAGSPGTAEVSGAGGTGTGQGGPE